MRSRKLRRVSAFIVLFTVTALYMFIKFNWIYVINPLSTQTCTLNPEHFTYQRDFKLPKNASKVRLLVWIMADPDSLCDRVIHQKATWGRRVEKLLVMSSKQDKDFPAIGLDVQNGRDHIAFKAKAAWKYIYEHYGNEYDFFMKVDPDSYLVVENLLEFLADKDPSKPHLFGHIFRLGKQEYEAEGVAEILGAGGRQVYVSGGAGEVLTRAALRLLVTRAFIHHDACWPDGQCTSNYSSPASTYSLYTSILRDVRR